MDEKNHMIMAIVRHKPGVLYNVANMFRRRNFNIESISVGPTEQTDLARMTITVKGNEKLVEQVIKQMRKLIDVITIMRPNPTNTVSREMALVKIHTPQTEIKSDVINYANIFRGHVVDASTESLTVEITGDSNKIDGFIDMMKTFVVKEVARTGITALSRGPKSIVDEMHGRMERGINRTNREKYLLSH